MRRLNVLRLRGLSIFNQLQFEEVLLRRNKENWFLLNSGMAGTSIVLGFSGKVAELVDEKAVRAASEQVTLIRRYSGGGTVVVDKSTLFASFVMNAGDVPSLPYPRDIMNWSETIYGPTFAAFGIPNFSLRENDYVFGEQKIGGNAQSISKDRWTHHTSFLWDFDETKMQYLQLPKKRPAYRGDRPHGDFVARVKEHVPSVEQLETRLIEQLRMHYDVVERSLEELQALTKCSLDERGEAIDLVSRTRFVELIVPDSIPSLVRTGPSCTNF